jgi:DNA repair exonuclease SbcCD nuclease subunit
MKIAVLNDTHCGIRNSAEIFLDNSAKFYAEVFFPYCEENKIEQILHLGDYYDHRKFVNFKALNHNRKHFLKPLRDRGMKMDIIPGNHDTYYKNTNNLNSLKECLGHFMNEIHIVMEPRVMEYGSLKMALLPWINSENYESSMNFIKECKADWLGGHLELNGFEMMRGVKNTHGMSADVFKKFELVLTGHFHCASRQDNIWYLGSQMEFFWSDAHDPKYFHVIDTETREVEKIRNPHTLFQKIVYNDEKMDYNNYNVTELDGKLVKVVVVNKSDTFTFDRFIDRIQNQNIHELKIAENFQEFLGENIEDEKINFDDTQEIIDSYIEAVDTDLNKDKIKIQVRELMTEAQALEFA